MRNIIEDYKLPDFNDPKMSETEARAAIQVVDENIRRLRAVRLNYENWLSTKYLRKIRDTGKKEVVNRGRTQTYHVRQEGENGY